MIESTGKDCWKAVATGHGYTAEVYIYRVNNDHLLFHRAALQRLGSPNTCQLGIAPQRFAGKTEAFAAAQEKADQLLTRYL